jgi:hypothetical protein
MREKRVRETGLDCDSKILALSAAWRSGGTQSRIGRSPSESLSVKARDSARQRKEIELKLEFD